MWYLSASSMANREGIHPDLIAVCDRALELSPIDFGIPKDGGLRTDKRQRELYLLGASKLSGFNKRSNHQDGNAIDFYAFVDGEASWERAHLTAVAAAFLQAASELGVRVQWGGHWKSFLDMPHIERIAD